MYILPTISIPHTHISTSAAQLKRIRSRQPSQPFTFGKAHFSVRRVVRVVFIVLAKMVCKRTCFNRYMGARLRERRVSLDRTRGDARFEPRKNLRQESSECEWDSNGKGVGSFHGSYRLGGGAAHFGVCGFGLLVDGMIAGARERCAYLQSETSLWKQCSDWAFKVRMQGVHGKYLAAGGIVVVFAL
ncbi:hypothetical protein BDR22DRAFT_843080 [Usnea florida]